MDDPPSAVYWLAHFGERVMPLFANTPSLEGVDGDFIKSWMVVLMFVVTLGVQVLTAARGSARTVSGEVVTREGVEFASSADLQSLQDDFEDFRDETRAQFTSAATGAAARVSALSEVMDKERMQLSGNLDGLRDKLGDKIDLGFSGVNLKLANISETIARHDAILSDLKPRFDAHVLKQSEAVTKLHDRINDVIRMKGGSTK